MSSSLSVVVSLVVSKKPYVLNSVFDNLLMSQKSQIGKGDLNKTNPSLLGIKKEWWSSKATEKLESEKVSKTLINQRGVGEKIIEMEKPKLEPSKLALGKEKLLTAQKALEEGTLYHVFLDLTLCAEKKKKIMVSHDSFILP
ncbi:uncharacterized protein LOC107632046 isoform X2 [Arachis ipaensis]|uniref:uncharacterized protein LOC107632046 isoform X2 n=1 Tax=Arachis ipaensis TaxID=130454 RepID=UPI0007AFD766|nr:uncharacterized protein LOC107632046 isoform X2 [Arachis ipaensis]XP_029147674.1 uncharacterized protein LOC112734773 isoform X1 [Arachis hypogaea]